MEPERTTPDPVVCIVDDDESVRKALSRLIGSLGLRAEAYASPEEFLGRAVDDEIACLLLDIQLPGMDGFELRDRTVAAGLDSPVIFITAHPDETDARARAAGGSALLRKPFVDCDLVAALRQAIGPGILTPRHDPHPTP